MFATCSKSVQTKPLLSMQGGAVPMAQTSAGTGFVTGTKIATAKGWKRVENLCRGDEALTFDAGFQKVIALESDQVFGPQMLCPKALWPLKVSAGVLGNRHDIEILPHQGVLVECDDASDPWGDPYVMVPGAALEGLAGVSRHAPERAARAFFPIFGEDQIVFANGGALLFSQAHWGARAGILPRSKMACNYNMLPIAAAKVLLEAHFETDTD